MDFTLNIDFTLKTISKPLKPLFLTFINKNSKLTQNIHSM